MQGPLLPAPRRGHYDRSVPTGVRQVAQRRRLLHALAVAIHTHGSGVTVDHITSSARVGRNTFYQHFANLSAAVRELETELTHHAELAFLDVAARTRTPLDRLRQLVSAWCELASRHSPFLQAVLRYTCSAAPVETGPIVTLRASLMEAVLLARTSGALSHSADPHRLELSLAAMQSAALVIGSGATPRDVELALVDILLGAFR